jgi:hypothetical protein
MFVEVGVTVAEISTILSRFGSSIYLTRCWAQVVDAEVALALEML